MSATVDATQRAAKIQALSIAFMDDASTIGLTNTYNRELLLAVVQELLRRTGRFVL